MKQLQLERYHQYSLKYLAIYPQLLKFFHGKEFHLLVKVGEL